MIKTDNEFFAGVTHGIVGGTASVAAGGDFGSGATNGVFGYAFNSLRHSLNKKTVQEEIDATMIGMEGTTFGSMDDAARAIRDRTSIAAISARYDIEIGIQFLSAGGQSVLVGNAVTQFNSKEVLPYSGLRYSESGRTRVGYLHTHPSGESQFSLSDARSYNSAGSAYLLLPGGRLRVLDGGAWRAAGSPTSRVNDFAREVD